MPTPKTTSTSMLDQYATQVLPHWDEFENFNNLQMSHFRLQHYKGKQRGKEIATNHMTHGAKKYDRAKRKRSAARGQRQSVGLPMPVLKKRDYVPIKGLRLGSTNVLYENLKKREMAGDLIVILVDEYLTSQVCSSCSDRDLIKMPGVRGFSVLKCRNCHKKWQRDVNAARNIMKITYSVWAGNGVPRAFQRRPRPN
ncbi:hypothetical protein MUCCIDRAFT_104551 [Mucor lusitanicus CBS 277.49]|uniref:Cas12f1-like TNB domain-containing protein n=1 Tax=Mucor lusitanicus CBS 277.49 TaxID=747725 RepID=A0A168PED8_MUCCL|nr:hypothetical protein MUCCIDRAFT_104551 [Mucor lusitanicus CBS 277.49]